MALFSQRKGIKPVSKTIQIDSVDSDLRNSLWNAFCMGLWERIDMNQYSHEYNANKFEAFFTACWAVLFKQPLDQKPSNFDSVITGLRRCFFECEWYELYDFVEFSIKHCPPKLQETFKGLCNMFLERENSAYRIVGEEVVEITSPHEIGEIETALATPLNAVRTHLQTALGHLSSREHPDFRNSIKESISAVEALARLVVGNSKATLGQLIKVLEGHAGIHPALKDAFSSLYGYTSDEGGIRHSLLEKADVTKAEATFMLVTCSAFVNYVVAKAAQKGLKLREKD